MTDIWTLEKLKALSYRQLQNLAQENGIKSNIKKLELISKLTAKLVSVHDLTEDETANEEMMEVDAPTKTCTKVVNSPVGRFDETFSVEENSLANSTYILAENVQKNSGDIFLSADESILAGNMDITQTLNTEKENARLTEKSFTSSNVSKKTTNAQSTNIPRPGTSSSNRFAKHHENLFSKMESIEDAHKKLEARLQAVSSNEVINRLATPKIQRVQQARRRFQSPLTPNSKDFKFGNIPAERIESVQKPMPPPDARSPRPIRRASRLPETDVKKLTTQAKRPTKIPTIIPENRISQLAIPKSAGAVPISSERRSYTPNKSPYKYVDTTKMSNAEFRVYQRERKQEQNRVNKMVIN